eukprot:scaffold645_cov247-Pinguiococcus_pyrenoidosus.AAC.30
MLRRSAPEALMLVCRRQRGSEEDASVAAKRRRLQKMLDKVSREHEGVMSKALELQQSAELLEKQLLELDSRCSPARQKSLRVKRRPRRSRSLSDVEEEGMDRSDSWGVEVATTEAETPRKPEPESADASEELADGLGDAGSGFLFFAAAETTTKAAAREEESQSQSPESSATSQRTSKRPRKRSRQKSWAE